MPVSFTFTKKGEREPTPVVEIDEEMCRMMGEPVHDRRFCFMYDYVTDIGIACTMRGPFDNAPLNEVIAKIQTGTEISQDEKDKMVGVLRHFLGGAYTFRSWR